jgi:hypothetical protein
MTRTHDKVRYTPKGEPYTPISAAQGVEDALKVLEGRWKLIILFSSLRRQSVALLPPRTGDPGNIAKNAYPTTSANGS